MSSGSWFAPVFKPTGHQARTTPNKRKRGQTEPSLTPSEDPVGIGTNESVIDPTRAGLNPSQATQYRLAGQPYNEDLPGSRFPHEAVKAVADDLRSESDEEDVTFHTTGGTSKRRIHSGLRRQHVAVLTAILHSCMLKEDYVRAGRAWGMLLRMEVDGQSFDLRSNGLWGVGAEILIFRDGQLRSSQAEEAEAYQKHQEESLNPQFRPPGRRFISLFSRHGFQKAKEYYERLILQYPYRKAAPTAVSSLDFYPAMFSFWICCLQDQGKMLSKSAQEAARTSLGQELHAKVHTNVRDNALEQASEISTRLDELLVSPPYLDDARLWKLRGMIALWEADLIHLPPTTAPDPTSLSAEAPSAAISFQSRQGQHVAATLKAKLCFETVARLGYHS